MYVCMYVCIVVSEPSKAAEALYKSHVFLTPGGHADEDQAMKQPSQLWLGAVLARSNRS